MQKDYFFNGGGSGAPPPLYFEPDWNSSWGEMPASSSAAVTGGCAIRELIGKLGSICGSPPPPFAATPDNNVISNYVKSLGNGNPLPPGGGGGGAATFSGLCNRSFKNGDLPYGSNANQCIGNEKQLPRVSSSPSLKQNNNPGPTHPESKPEYLFPELNHRKKRTLSRKQLSEEEDKGTEADEHSTAKRSKPAEEATESDNNGVVKTEEETTNNNYNNNNQKPLEPPKDYIHVRARRGQATDSHSLAERVRREKISERMKLLQDLVPGCSKVTGKALMLDEIINYVQSLQRQVEFLSMKLAAVNPRLDTCQSNVSLPHTAVFPLDSLAPAFHSQQQYPHERIPQLHTNIVKGAESQCPMYTLDTSLRHSLGMQFPAVDGFGENLAQFPSIFEDDLQSIVHMGFNRISSKDTTLHPRDIPSSIP